MEEDSNEREKNKKVKKKKTLKLLHWNANSVIGKNSKVCELVAEMDPDVISINETRTDSTTESNIFKICE